MKHFLKIFFDLMNTVIYGIWAVSFISRSLINFKEFLFIVIMIWDLFMNSFHTFFFDFMNHVISDIYEGLLISRLLIFPKEYLHIVLL